MIALVGLPGTGKSSAGRLLAGRMGLPFFDCDTEFERRAGVPVAQFFASEGEASFRSTEAALLEELCRQRDGVVATGGGVVVADANRALLRSCSTCVWLQADIGTLVDRLGGGSGRPLLKGDVLARLTHLHDVREPLYRSVAAFTVWTDQKSAQAVADEIAGMLTASRSGCAVS